MKKKNYPIRNSSCANLSVDATAVPSVTYVSTQRLEPGFTVTPWRTTPGFEVSRKYLFLTIRELSSKESTQEHLVRHIILLDEIVLLAHLERYKRPRRVRHGLYLDSTKVSIHTSARARRTYTINTLSDSATGQVLFGVQPDMLQLDVEQAHTKYFPKYALAHLFLPTSSIENSVVFLIPKRFILSA